MTEWASVRGQVAIISRALANLNLIDYWSSISVRVPGSDVIATTPRWEEPVHPRHITADQVLLTSRDGAVVDGVGEVPHQYHLALAMLKADETPRSAVIAGSSPDLLALGLTGTAMQPLLHSRTFLCESTGWLDDDGLVLNEGRAAAARDQIRDHVVAHQSGICVWVMGDNLVDAAINLYFASKHATATIESAVFSESGGLSDTEIARITSSKSDDRVMSEQEHYEKFFIDSAQCHNPLFTSQTVRDWEEAGASSLAIRAALSCRILWKQGTLVDFLEHVSVRLPDSDRWCISSSRLFAHMTPSDLATLDMDDNWFAGPPPPGFKRAHGEIFRRRPEVQAIVHTHDLYGRLFGHAGVDCDAFCRLQESLDFQKMPVNAKPSKLFDSGSRDELLASLGDNHSVHTIGHGSEFLGESLGTAVVRAIERELVLKLYHSCLKLNRKPRSLQHRTISDIRGLDLSFADRWWFYCGQVGELP